MIDDSRTRPPRHDYDHAPGAPKTSGVPEPRSAPKLTDDARKQFVMPRVALPTVLLALAAWSLWLSALWLISQGASPAWTIPMAAVGVFIAFTPAHESMHRAAARAAWLNGAIGRGCAALLMAPLPAVRPLHLDHHRHTNAPDGDPDIWSGSGPRLLLPLRWATQDLHYYALVLRNPSRLSRPERVESALTLLLYVSIAWTAVALGHGDTLLFAWVIPARVAVFLLAFTFDYLPHRPHQIPASVDRYRATRILDSAVLHVVLIGQSHHLVHHLYPAVPFYRYRRLWRAMHPGVLGLKLTSSTRDRVDLHAVVLERRHHRF
jgi:beta-carotene hydroxylase